MHVDDRLATVLRMRADTERGMRVQFRQLVALLGEGPLNKTSQLVQVAFARFDELCGLIPPVERAAILGEAGWRLRNPQLVARLSGTEPAVALAALRRARLSEQDWLALIPSLSGRAQALLKDLDGLPPRADALLAGLGVHHRALPSPQAADSDLWLLEPAGTNLDAGEAEYRDENADASEGDVFEDAWIEDAGQEELPEKDWEEEAAGQPPQTGAAGDKPDLEPGSEGIADLRAALDPGHGSEEISAIVARIEAFRRNRAGDPAGAQTPGPRKEQTEPLAGPIAISTDPNGRIDSAVGSAAPCLVGRLLAEDVEEGGQRASLRRHLPLRHLPLAFAAPPQLEGDWILDTVPRFAEATGAFLGHCGILRRLSDSDARTDTQADRLRQLLHEMKTPLNAIQGFAEIIQQQLVGSTPHRYRALAAGIAAETAVILGAFDDMDRLARLENGDDSASVGECDLVAILEPLVANLRRGAGDGVELSLLAEPGAHRVRLARSDAQLLCWRVLSTLTNLAERDEALDIVLRREGTHSRLEIALPRALRDGDIFAREPEASQSRAGANTLGVGFALRLARAEARSAGGELRHAGERVFLHLPGGLLNEGAKQDEEAA